MQESTLAIIRTLSDFNFGILDFAADKGCNISQKAIALFQKQNPQIEATDDIIVDIIRYVHCVYKTKLQTLPLWSNTSIVLNNCPISCTIEGYCTEALVKLSRDEISVEVNTHLGPANHHNVVLAHDSETTALLTASDIGLLANSEAVRQIKKVIIETFLNSYALNQKREGA